ncbi:MAG: M48 family metallopeptidase [Bacteroidota bacterium]
MKNDFYPASPKNVPEALTQLPASYRNRVVAVLIAIILFILLFIGLVVFSGYSVYWAIFYPMATVNKLTILVKIGLIGITAMFFVFTLKFLFKSNNHDNPTDIVLKEKDHPRLFDFIRQLCKETGAPYPKKVVVNEQINAAVYYDKPLLSMFFPVRKNLLIGLGLVNSLNLSEFKAVLAHEFGHFSQRSMKLGSYVYMANRIIHDMVYNRDGWDEALDTMSQSDFRIAIFAWILKAVVWVIRQFLALVYKGINLLHASLSRQMEFNADLFAVSVTGSDQIVFGLSKLGRSSYAMNMAMNQLTDAADHKLYSSNIFFHHAEAESYLKEKVDGYQDRQLVANKEGQQMIFTPDDTDVPNMYASHPPNYDRELNVRKIEVEGPTDERSPWILFGNADQLKEILTKKLYEQGAIKPKEAAFNSPEEVHQFIQAELEETTFDKVYCDTYDTRFIHPYPLEEASATLAAQFPDKASVQQAIGNVYGEELQTAMQNRKNLQSELEQLRKVAQQSKVKEFEFRGQRFAIDELSAKGSLVNEEINGQYDDWFKNFDENIYRLHSRIVDLYDLPQKQMYLKRCAFQNQVIDAFFKLEDVQSALNGMLSQIYAAGELSEEDVYHAEQQLNTFRNQVEEVLKATESVEIPPLQYIESGQLRTFLLDGQLIRGGQRLLSNVWIQKFSEQLGTTVSRIRRLYFKNLGQIISLQEEIRSSVAA